MDSLAERISRNTTMGVADIHGVLRALEEEIIYALEDGGLVELGNICLFYPNVSGKGVDKVEDFNTATHITRKGTRIRSKRSLNRKMEDVPLEREE